MMRIFSAFVLAMALALAVAAPCAQAEGTEPPKSNSRSTVKVYQRGQQFVVAIYRTDGSAALALVEPPKTGRDGTGKAASKPDYAGLLQSGRVTFTVDLAPDGTLAGPAIAGARSQPPQGKPADGKSGGKANSGALTRKQKLELRTQFRTEARMIGAIRKTLADGVVVATAASEPAHAR